jgi:hypothetical protein
MTDARMHRKLKTLLGMLREVPALVLLLTLFAAVCAYVLIFR